MYTHARSTSDRNIRESLKSIPMSTFRESRVASNRNSVVRQSDQQSFRSYMSGKYFHKSQYITDLSKAFTKESIIKQSNYASPSQSFIKKDIYQIKLPTPDPAKLCAPLYIHRKRNISLTQQAVSTTQRGIFTLRQRLKNATSLPASKLESRLILVLFNHNLKKCKSIEDLNYCYFYMPFPKQYSSVREAELTLQQVGQHLRGQLKLGQIELFFYTKDGEPINSIFECNPEHQTILVSANKQFNGIHDCPTLLELLTQLEDVLPQISRFDVKSLEDHIGMQYKGEIQQIANLLQNSPKSELTLSSKEMEQLYQKCKKRLFTSVNNNYQNKMHRLPLSLNTSRQLIDKNTYLVEDGLICNSDRIEFKQPIIDRYDKEIKSLEKDIAFNKNSDSIPTTELVEGKLVSKENTDYMEQHINLLQGFLKSKQRINLKKTSMQVDFSKQTSKPKQKQVSYVPLTKKEIIQKVDKYNTLLTSQNIPSLQQQTKFTRKEIYQAFMLYKALEAVSSQMQPNYTIGEGVCFEAFRKGIYQVFMQPNELAKMMFNKIDFNFSGNLNWAEFLDLMVVIKAKSLADRVDLFIKIADKDGNGLLSQQEVYNLTKICLSRFIQSGDMLLDPLCTYFTKIIFETLETDLKDEIPLQKIKDAILNGGQNSELLQMFCGADL